MATLSEELIEFLLSTVDEKETPPETISVNRPESQKDCLKVVGIWMEMKESQFGFQGSTKGDGTEEFEDRLVELPTRYSAFLSEGALYTRLQNVFSEYRSRIDYSSGKLSGVSLSTLGEDGMFYTTADAPYRVMGKFSVESDSSLSEYSDAVYDYLISEISKVDPDVTREGITNVEASFSDCSECTLVRVSCSIETPTPHRYYKGVSDLSEYINTISESSSEKEELEEQETYTVLYRLNSPDSEPCSETKGVFEPIMRDAFSECVSISGEHTFEGEMIQYEDGTESLVFWIRMPFLEDDV